MNLTRRALTLAGGATLLAGCAGLRPPAIIEVNASTTGPGPDGPQAQLDTGFDPTRRITAPVMINGRGPYEFVVDTGANRTVIAAELAAELGLPRGAPANVHGVVGVEPAQTAIIETFDVDTLRQRNMSAPALPRAQLGADGLLGVDVLRGRRVLINFRERRLSISSDRLSGDDPTAFEMKSSATRRRSDLGRPVTVPATYRFGQLIIVGADLKGRPVTAFVDSGSQSTVGNNALRRLALGTRPGDTSPTRRTVPVYSATSQTAEGELGEVALLRIGGLNVTNLTTTFADLHVFEIWGLQNRPTLMLGVDVLSQFNALELDYARREVVFYLPPRARAP